MQQGRVFQLYKADQRQRFQRISEREVQHRMIKFKPFIRLA